MDKPLIFVVTMVNGFLSFGFIWIGFKLGQWIYG